MTERITPGSIEQPPLKFEATLYNRGLESSVGAYERVRSLAQGIHESGGRALLVGGSVRDMMMGKDPKDFDLEVYQMSPELLEEVIQEYGTVSAVGKAFGILKVFCEDGIDLDISLPRTDSKIAEGHRGFTVKTDPFMSIDEAAKRRDFTINSMAFDPLTGELFDPYRGMEDLENKILRVTDSERFADDPLRVMRALQFVGRFGFTVDLASKEIMRGMVGSLPELPKERFHEEWKKLLLKSDTPSVGLELGMELGIFDELYPEFSQLQITPQDRKHHPEGDVWTHTKMVVDQAALIARREQLSEDRAFILLLSALCHDIGKPETTVIHDSGSITSYGHEQVGSEKTRKFLHSIKADTHTKQSVLALVESHMWAHSAFGSHERGERITDGAIRKVATRLYPATIDDLSLLSEADATGTTAYTDIQNSGKLVLPKQFPEGDWLRERAEKVGVKKERPENVINGRDLIAVGLTPGASFGQIIRLANELRDDFDYTREAILEVLTADTSQENIIFQLRGKISAVK